MTETELPRWDMDSFYGSTPEQNDHACAASRSEVERLRSLFDRHGIGTADVTESFPVSVEAFEEVLNTFNRVHADASDLEGFLYCLVSGDTANAHAQARLAEARELRVALAQLDSRFVAWAGSLD